MRVVLLFLCLLTFVSCGAKKMAIDHADTLLVHQITKRLPLYSQQKKELGDDVQKFLKDSKPLALEASPLLENIEVNHEKVGPQYKRFEAFYMKLANRFSGLLSRYMAKLDAKQQKEFFETLDLENKELARKDKTDILESVEERFKYFMGTITEAQKQILVNYEEYFINRHKTRLKGREKLLNDIKLTYADDSSLATKTKTFQELMVKYQERNAEENKNAEILEKIVPTMTDLQKKHFHKETQEIKELLGYFMTVDY